MPEAVDADSADDERENEEYSADVGDDEADAKPVGVLELVREIVPTLLSVDPFSTESHQDPAW